jgi:hypothetical protein
MSGSASQQSIEIHNRCEELVEWLSSLDDDLRLREAVGKVAVRDFALHMRDTFAEAFNVADYLHEMADEIRQDERAGKELARLHGTKP